MKRKHQSVVVINDHQLVSELLEPHLSKLGFEKIETYTDAEAALDRVISAPPELVVIDMMLPIFYTGNGEKTDFNNSYILMDSQVTFRGVQKIKVACPKTKILILTGERYPHPFLLGFEAGARGISSKLDTFSTFIKTLEQVMAGKTQITSDRMQKLIAEYRQFPLPHLNSFEIQILELVQKGLESPETGRQLGYSEKTIRNAISKINEKLGTDNRYKAMQRAVDMGLVGWRTGCEEN